LVGAVTTRPPAAFSSFTAIAKADIWSNGWLVKRELLSGTF
jgi:hypothetical protein